MAYGKILKGHALVYDSLESIHPDLKEAVADVLRKRNLRVLSTMAGAAVAASAIPFGIAAGLAAAGIGEGKVIRSTSRFGNLIKTRSTEIFRDLTDANSYLL